MFLILRFTKMTSEQLKQFRLKMGLTRKQMCKALDKTSIRIYEKWERGESPVPNLMRLALIGLKAQED